jgi:hypothetical protein
MQTPFLRSLLFVGLLGGCAGSGQFTASATMPELVVISPGVQVIADYDEPIFYSERYYWRNQGGFWYRSSSHNRGWARVSVAPVAIRSIERPSAYIRYRASGRAGTTVAAPRQRVAPTRYEPPHDNRRNDHDRRNDAGKHNDNDKRDNDNKRDNKRDNDNKPKKDHDRKDGHP